MKCLCNLSTHYFIMQIIFWHNETDLMGDIERTVRQLSVELTTTTTPDHLDDCEKCLIHCII